MDISLNFHLLFIVKILITVFVAVLFLQSGFNKVLDFKGNQSYIQSVFAKTPLAPISSLLFILITLLEVTAGVLCLVGVILSLKEGYEALATWGMILAATALLCLFAGQRIAKDYAGAASLVAYFLLVVFGLFLYTFK